jgi:Zn-dependent protease with chaperone function
MRFSPIWVLIYFLLCALFLGLNWEYAGSQFSTNLLFTRTNLHLILILALFSFLWMLVLLVYDLWQIEKMKRQIEGLKAKLHDVEEREVKGLREEVSERLNELERRILDRIDRLEATLPIPPTEPQGE